METVVLIVASVVQSGIFAWIVKELISYKRHQWEESAKHELDLKKMEHEVRFKLVYDKVSNNIIDLFQKLAVLKRAMRAFTPDPIISWQGAPSKEELYKPVGSGYDEAFNMLHEQRLLIPIPIFNQVADYLKGVRAIIEKIKSGMRAEHYGVGDSGQGKTFWEKATEDFAAMELQYQEIHEVMQAFLGFKN